MISTYRTATLTTPALSYLSCSIAWCLYRWWQLLAVEAISYINCAHGRSRCIVFVESLWCGQLLTLVSDAACNDACGVQYIDTVQYRYIVSRPTAEDKGVSNPTDWKLLPSLLHSIHSILCKGFHAYHPVHLLPRSLSIHPTVTTTMHSLIQHQNPPSTYPTPAAIPLTATKRSAEVRLSTIDKFSCLECSWRSAYKSSFHRHAKALLRAGVRWSSI